MESGEKEAFVIVVLGKCVQDWVVGSMLALVQCDLCFDGDVTIDDLWRE